MTILLKQILANWLTINDVIEIFICRMSKIKNPVTALGVYVHTQHIHTHTHTHTHMYTYNTT